MDNPLAYVHQHAVGFAIGLGCMAWLFAQFQSESEKGWVWVALLSGAAAVAVFIWHLADPWIKDTDLVQPLGMIEMVQARLKINPEDKAARQAWQMIRDKMAEVDPETRACGFARRNLATDPALSLRRLVPDLDQDKMVLQLLNSATRAR